VGAIVKSRQKGALAAPFFLYFNLCFVVSRCRWAPSLSFNTIWLPLFFGCLKAQLGTITNYQWMRSFGFPFFLFLV